MKCRRIVDEYIDEQGQKQHIQQRRIVWFGSVGKNQDGTAIFYNQRKNDDGEYINKHDNFSKDEEGVKDLLTQQLSVIKGELWFSINYGIPLLDRITSKAFMDAFVTKIIDRNKYVKLIESFESSVKDGHTYKFNVNIKTVFSDESMDVNNG